MSIELTMIFVAKLYEVLVSLVILPITRRDIPKEQEDKVGCFSPSGTYYLKPRVGVRCI